MNISGIIKNFADLKRRTGNVTLKASFLKFVEVPDGNYIILGGSLGILVDTVA